MAGLAIIIRGRVVLLGLKWAQRRAQQKIRDVSGTVSTWLPACHMPSGFTTPWHVTMTTWWTLSMPAVTCLGKLPGSWPTRPFTTQSMADMISMVSIVVCNAIKFIRNLRISRKLVYCYATQCLGIVCHRPLTSTWLHLRCDVGLKEGEYWKICLCVTVLCTVIMVHKDTSSSYRSVDCIWLWCCLV